MTTTTQKTSKEAKTLKVTLIRSTIGCSKQQRAVVQALGLSKINQTKVLPDNASIRGSIAKVSHMLRVEQ